MFRTWWSTLLLALLVPMFGCSKEINDDGIFKPTLPPAPLDSPRIAFISNRGGNGTDIYLLNPVDKTVSRITNDSYVDAAPVIAPGGTAIVFMSDAGDGFHLVGTAADGSHRVALTHGPGNEYLPRFSPDGRRIVFTRIQESVVILTEFSASSRFRPMRSSSGLAWTPAPESPTVSIENVYIINVDGTNEQALTTDNGTVNLDWSPDGASILAMDPNGLCAIAVATGLKTRLAAGYAGQAEYSPDGTHIAFTRHDSVFVANAPKFGSPRDISLHDYDHSFVATWSPDGARIALTAVNDGSSADIFVRNADGSGTFDNLTNNSFDDGGPSWGPRTPSP